MTLIQNILFEKHGAMSVTKFFLSKGNGMMEHYSTQTSALDIIERSL